MIDATTIVNSAQSRIAGDPMWSVNLPSRGAKEGCDGGEHTDIAKSNLGARHHSETEFEIHERAP
jgi:hypothetical protein